jgi:hypothetical protein
VGFKPTISAGERPHTFALDFAASVISTNNNNNNNRININIFMNQIKYISINSLPFIQQAKKLQLKFNCNCISKNLITVNITFMCSCILRKFQYISNKMQRYTVYLYLESPLLVSGGTSTHHQERKQLYLQHLVFVTPLLLPSTIAADISNGVTNTRRCRYSCMRSW